MRLSDKGKRSPFKLWLCHFFRLHSRRVEVWETNAGKLMRGTRCSCGKLEDIRPLGAQQNKKQGKYHWS